MFKTAMEVDVALGTTLSAIWRMPRGNLVNSLVRSLVRTCIRTAGQSQRVAAARAAARAVAARTSAAARTPQRTALRTASPVFDVGLAKTPSASAMPRSVMVASAPASEPAFARVSARRDAQPATLNPVRIYSTPSRTVMVGNLSEVSRFLDVSIEREQARVALRG